MSSKKVIISRMHEATRESRSKIIKDIIALGDLIEVNKRLQEFEELERSNCVVRALESALAAPATLEEIRMRFADIQGLRADIDRIPAAPTLELNAKRNRLISGMEHAVIARYVERVARHDTPLGRALSTHTLSFGFMPPDAIVQHLRDNQIILLGLNIPNRHLAHVQLIDGAILRVSDYEEFVNLEENREYDTITVTKKDQ